MHTSEHESGTALWAIVGGVATVFAVRSGRRAMSMPLSENGVDLGKCFDLFPDQRELFWKVLVEREEVRPGGPICGRISGR